MPTVKRPEMSPSHVGVDLGRAEVAVPEEKLHHAQVGPSVDQVGGKRVTENVGTDPRLEPHASGVAAKNRPDPLTGQGPSAGVHEKPRGFARAEKERTGGREVALEPAPGLLAHRNDAFLAALAANPENTLAGAVGGGSEIHQFAHTKTAGVEQLEERPVAQAKRPARVWGLDQRGDFLLAQRARQGSTEARTCEREGRIVATLARGHQESVVASKSAQKTGERARAAAGRLNRGKTGEKIVAPGPGEKPSPCPKETDAAPKIKRVGRHRVGRESVGEPARVKKALEETLVERGLRCVARVACHSARR